MEYICKKKVFIIMEESKRTRKVFINDAIYKFRGAQGFWVQFILSIQVNPDKIKVSPFSLSILLWHCPDNLGSKSICFQFSFRWLYNFELIIWIFQKQ